MIAFFEFGDLPPLFIKNGLVMRAFGTDLLEVGEFLIPMRGKVLKFMPCGGFVIPKSLQIGRFIVMLGRKTFKCGCFRFMLGAKNLDRLEPLTMRGFGLLHGRLHGGKTLLLGTEGLHTRVMHAAFFFSTRLPFAQVLLHSLHLDFQSHTFIGKRCGFCLLFRIQSCQDFLGRQGSLAI